MTHDFAPTATNEIEGVPRDDNARKFLLDGLTPEFLLHVGAKRFDLVIDFIEFGVDREVKLVHKTAEDGTVKMLRTTKVVVDGLRTSDPVVLSEDAYKAELNRSVRKVVKQRYEFEYEQHGIQFSMKYDDFEASNLHMLEVDGDAETRDSFVESLFIAPLTEVTDDPRYTGSEIVAML